MSLVELIEQFSADQLAQSKTASNELGKDAFLQLLVTQMKYQDPLDPMKNEDFVAQLAQFNSLEQMMNLNESFEKMLVMQTLAQASAFIGQQVGWYNTDGTTGEGLVEAVEVIDGEPRLIVGTELVDVSTVFAITKPTE
ncbi:MAG TPA: flagellar hook capping FlgD N-terminal domain-containing protein [bacterium]|nr:flagellar hook capping FlgD N-terminal domain-containing protein [bacterium]